LAWGTTVPQFGVVMGVDFTCKKKADLLRSCFDGDVVPPHIAIVNDDTRVTKVPSQRAGSNKRGKISYHEYPVKWIGRCIENRKKIPLTRPRLARTSALLRLLPGYQCYNVFVSRKAIHRRQFKLKW